MEGKLMRRAKRIAKIIKKATRGDNKGQTPSIDLQLDFQHWIRIYVLPWISQLVEWIGQPIVHPHAYTRQQWVEYWVASMRIEGVEMKRIPSAIASCFVLCWNKSWIACRSWALANRFVRNSTCARAYVHVGVCKWTVLNTEKYIIRNSHVLFV